MKSFLSTKSKKVIAVVLSVAVVLLGVISVSGAANTEQSEVAPMVFNAGFDFSYEITSGNTNNGVQAGPIWYYEYATDRTNPTWELLARSDSSMWRPQSGLNMRNTGIRDFCQMDIDNYYVSNKENPYAAKDAAVAYKFVAPKDGYIIMNNQTASIVDNTSGKYNAIIKITKNKEVLHTYTATKEQPATIKDVSFEVKAGDEIRFEMCADKTMDVKDDRLKVSWNPRFYLYNESVNYTSEDKGILGKLTTYMSGIFGGVESTTMDADATVEKQVAINTAKNANNSVYSVYDSIYGNDNTLLMGEDSPWIYGVETGIEPEFDTENADTDITVTAVTTADGLKITPNATGSNIFNIVAANDTENHNYVVNGSEFVIPTTDIALPYKLQLKYGTKSSGIYSVDANGTLSEVTVSTVKKELTEAATNNGVITVKDANNNEKYEINYSRAAGAAERAVKFNAKRGEKMRFGFKVPYSAHYEISAPITVEGQTEAYYSASYVRGDTVTVLTPPTKYTKPDTLCTSQAYLHKGDIVWFEAYSYQEAVINIGVPKIINIKQSGKSNADTAYSYTATDYIESKTGNGYSYDSSTSAENTRAAWSFGYIDGEDKILKPYTVMNNGLYYKVAEYQTAGTLFPSRDDNVNVNDDIMLSRRNQLFGCLDSTTGIYMQFAAPVGGEGTLTLTNSQPANGFNLTVIRNGKVIKSYEGDVPANEAISLGTTSPNEIITLMYEGQTATTYLGSPAVKIGGGALVPFNFKNAEGISLYSVRASKLLLPALKGYSGLCPVAWEKGGKQYPAGTEFASSGKADFTAIYRYYGDVDGDDNITYKFDEDGIDNDYAALSAHLTGKAELDGADAAASDIKTDGRVNVADLLRLRKFIVNGTYDAN